MSIAIRHDVEEVADEIYYPESDGEPMAETPVYVLAIILLFQAMEDFLTAQTDIYIAANMFWYWLKGDNTAKRAPDVMTIKGVGRRQRRSFFSWQENGAIPCTIFEIMSKKTWHENLYEKRPLYQRLGVREYFMFDPESAYIQPGLQGYRLNAQRLYVPVQEDQNGCLHCEELDLLLTREGQLLRLIDAKSGVPILTRKERVQAEILRAEGEQVRADAVQALADAERLRAEAERKRAEAEQVRADAAQAQAELDRKRAEAQQARADAAQAQAELERKRAEAQQARADTAQAQAELDRKRAEAQQARADTAQARADILERELARLKAQMKEVGAQ